MKLLERLRWKTSFFINDEFGFGHIDFGVKFGCANQNVPEAARDPG